jgi:hypothetical protein
MTTNTTHRLSRYLVPGLAALVIGGATALAPIANADPSPLVPYGTNPTSPFSPQYHVDDHDEINTTNGFYDLPF